MDPERFREAYQRLQALDERMTHKVRPPSGGGLIRPTLEQLEKRVYDLSSYTLDLKEIVDELFQSIAGSPSPKPPPGGQAPPS